ncbi:MAG: Ger(x)C family spore germination protein [Clostridiales bacterium]|nr:Ger(x)C family spore germination protein [Clostridiales bacterium]
MKRAIHIMIIMSLLLCTGCWDKKEIEQWGYVLGIAVDPPTLGKGTGSKEGEEGAAPAGFRQMDISADKPTYDMTIQLPIIKESPSLAASGGGGGPESGSPSKTWQITQTGDTFLSMEREIESRTSLTLFYGHLQVLVISDSVARDGLDKIADFFLRHREIRPKVDIYIAEGSAKKILDVSPKIEDHSATYLKQLLMNSDRSSRIVHKADLRATMNFIRAGNDFVLPKVEANKEEIKIKGGAIFKKAKMVGWADEMDIESINFIRDLYRGGVIVGDRPGDEPGLISMEVTKSKGKIKPIITGDQVSFDIFIKIQGEYDGQIGFLSDKQADKAYMDKCEKEFTKVVREQCNRTIKKMQEEYKADVFQLNKILRTSKPAYWEEIKEDWDEIYPDVKINLDVEVKLKQLGNFK